MLILILTQTDMLIKNGELKKGYKQIEYSCIPEDGDELYKYEYFSGILNEFLLRSAKALDAYKKYYFYKQPIKLQSSRTVLMNCVLTLLSGCSI